KAGFLKSHSVRELGKHLHVRPALSEWSNCTIGNLQIIVPVSCLNVLVLEKSRSWQQNIREVRGVGEELLVHNGKEIGTQKAAHYTVVVRGDRGRIRVVNKHCLHRRILQLCEGFPEC